MDADAYLRRIGLTRGDVEARGRETLARLQRAHVLTVPFENLAIAGDPWDDRAGAGVSLDPATLEAKIVDRERGGFCYELNGAFVALLDELGFEATRNAGRIVGDGGVELPANHLVPTVDLDRTYVADVGARDRRRLERIPNVIVVPSISISHLSSSIDLSATSSSFNSKARSSCFIRLCVLSGRSVGGVPVCA